MKSINLQEVPRKSNFDLLRIVALFMVVLIHISTMGIKLLPIDHFNWYIATFLDALTRPAVHIYILMGGYFLGTRSISPANALKRTLTLLPPLLLIALITLLFFVRPLNLETTTKLARSFMAGRLQYPGIPWFGHLWFLYPYAVLISITPLINSATTSLNQKEFKYLLVVMATIFMVVPSITLTTGFRLFYTIGQPFTYFIVSYMTGAYIKRFSLPFSTKQLLLIFAGASLWTWTMTIAQAHWLSPIEVAHPIGSLGTYDNMFVNEQIGIYIAAIALFGTFNTLKTPQISLVQAFNKSGFYGYTIHMLILLGLTILVSYKTLFIFSPWYLPITLGLAASTTILSLLYGKILTKILPF